MKLSLPNVPSNVYGIDFHLALRESLVFPIVGEDLSMEAGRAVSDLNAYEVYAGFLIFNLPRIAAVAIYSPSSAPQQSRYQVLKHTIQLIKHKPGLNLEFGVYKGKSLEICKRLWPEGIFYGFDSFEGFPEDDRSDWNKDFSVSCLPEVPQGCELVAGYFEETLPAFFREHTEPLNFVNIDCDIFSSADFVLGTVAEQKRVRTGLILHFDELVNYQTFAWNEMLALFKFLLRIDRDVNWLVSHGPVRSLHDYIMCLESKSFPSWDQDKASGYRQQVTLRLSKQKLDLSWLRFPHMENQARDLGSRLKTQIQRFAPEKVLVFQEIEALMKPVMPA